ncbi:MAG: glutamate carboxypeptidase [Pseudonocardiales bacterium]|nr:MAG: glutamate carboxypeptidase [Pseudonocardiales bacterium]
MPHMLADLRRLVEAESPATEPAALASSAEVLAAVGAALLGAEPERLVEAGRTHLRWRLGSGRRRLLLLGHHDTVWPLGTLARMPWSLDGDIARGPGCFDMKAGLVLVLHALAALGGIDAADLDGVTVFVSGDEELGSPTAGRLIEAEARGCLAVLVTEPSADGGALKTARKGIASYEVTVRGVAAHAGLDPERGVNAVVELAHQVLAVAALNPRWVHSTVTPTLLAGGSTGNTVPADGRLVVDVRAHDRVEQEAVERALHELVAVTPGATVEVLRTMSIPPLEAASSADLFARAQALATSLGLAPLRGTMVGGGSDGNRTAALGIPTLDGLGAVGGGAHAADEHVRVAALPGRAALVCALVRSILAAPDDERTRQSG